MPGPQMDISKFQSLLDWLKTKIFLDSISQNAKNRTVKRGQVYKCNLGIGIGSEMQKERPCVIIQNNIGNLKSGNTIVAPITHDTAKLSCLVPVSTQTAADGIVILDGQVNVSNIICVSKARLGDYIADLPPNEMKNVDSAMAGSLGLMRYYADIKQKLEDKLEYIDKIKKQRNEAQDVLSRLMKKSDTSTYEELEKKISELIDKEI